jgi:hypothetical protein
MARDVLIYSRESKRPRPFRCWVEPPSHFHRKTLAPNQLWFRGKLQCDIRGWWEDGPVAYEGEEVVDENIFAIE